jgi:hypothetical protein
MTIPARFLLAAACAATLVGLGGCGLYKWEKPGADDAAFRADSGACQQVQNPDGYDACMKSRGWSLN